MDSVTPGVGHDAQSLAGRIERIELALGPYQELDVVAEIKGRGLTNMRMLAQAYGPEDGGRIAGAFYTLITDTGTGDIYLQGGTVNGGAVATTALKVYDGGTTSWEGSTDNHLYLEVSGAGEVTDGVLLPGFNITTATPTIGTPLEHDPPTAAASSGTAYVSLGVFVGDAFYPAESGNINITFCPSGFTVGRES